MSNLILPMNNSKLIHQAQRMMTNATKDNGLALWSKILHNDQNGNIINAESTLHYDDYKDLTDDVLKARELANTGVNDLRSAGLIRQSSIGKTMVDYENMNTFDATTSMDGSNRTENRSNYKQILTPQPVFHTDFTIGWRNEGYSYKSGDGIQESVFRVEEAQDKALFLGEPDLGIYNGSDPIPLYGYTTQPNRATSTIADWANPANNSNIVGEAIALIGKMYTDNKIDRMGSIIMYVANDVFVNLANDYSTEKGDRTLIERIEAHPAIRSVRPNKHLVDGDVVCVDMTSSSVQWSQATATIAAPWVKGHDLEDGRFTIYACGTPILKEDREGRTGIVHGSKA